MATIKNPDFVTGSVWVALGSFFCIGGVKYGLGSFQFPGPGFFPFVSGALLAGAGFVLILSAARRELRNVKDEVAAGRTAGKAHWKDSLPLFLTVSFLFIYNALLEVLGFLLTTFVFIFLLAKLSQPTKWLIPFIFSVITVIVSMFLFIFWLECQLPGGILDYIRYRF